MTTLSGPMFEPSITDFWQSSYAKQGAHYNNYGCRDEEKNGMAALHRMFPKGEADDMNFCLFSTSGVHGTYTTIEEAEREFTANQDINLDEEDKTEPHVTFLIVHPRICCLRHGNCYPRTVDDFAFLKKLRGSSWEAVQTIGAHEEEPVSSGGRPEGNRVSSK